MTSQNKVSLLCRYGGNFIEESGKVSYKDGTNRMIVLEAQEIDYSHLLSKLLEVCKWTNIGGIKYKHPEFGLDCLISVENDEDLRNMMQAFATQSNGTIQLFVSEAQQTLRMHDTITPSSIGKEITVFTEDDTKHMILLGAEEINYAHLLSKLLEVCKWTNIRSIKYKHPELSLNCPVSVENDEDLRIMIQAFETQNNGPIQLLVSEAQ